MRPLDYRRPRRPDGRPYPLAGRLWREVHRAEGEYYRLSAERVAPFNRKWSGSASAEDLRHLEVLERRLDVLGMIWAAPSLRRTTARVERHQRIAAAVSALAAEARRLMEVPR